MLIRDELPTDDVELATDLSREGTDPVKVIHVLASALFIHGVGQIAAHPRELVRASSFADGDVSMDEQKPLEQLLDNIAEGGPLLKEARSHHVHRVFRRAKGHTIVFLDRCFLDWGVHHFHVHPKSRNRDRLVYAAFDDQRAYLLALGGHSSLNNADLVNAMSEICPQLLTVLHGVRGDTLSVQEVQTLRRKNAGFVVEQACGAVAPRILCSVAGIPLEIIRNVDYEIAHIDHLESVLQDPASPTYQAIQRSLGPTSPHTLSVVPDRANFCGKLLLSDSISGKRLQLIYDAERAT